MMLAGYALYTRKVSLQTSWSSFMLESCCAILCTRRQQIRWSTQLDVHVTEVPQNNQDHLQRCQCCFDGTLCVGNGQRGR